MIFVAMILAPKVRRDNPACLTRSAEVGTNLTEPYRKAYSVGA